MRGVEKILPIETPLFRRAAQFWYELENEKNQLSELIATADPRAQAEALIQEACKLAERYACSPSDKKRPGAGRFPRPADYSARKSPGHFRLSGHFR